MRTASASPPARATRRHWSWLIPFAILLTGADTGAQSYSRGQTVAPAFEGWTRNPDGSFDLLFGYMNRNWEEELDVPVGRDNQIEPGTPDQGQPTHFLPRRNRFAFRVRVPKDFGEKELIWTLTTHGKTEQAHATLRTDYFLDELSISAESGAFGGGSSNGEERTNTPPALTVEGPMSRTARVGELVTLVAQVRDDGIPKQRQYPRPAAAAGRPPVDRRYIPPRNSTIFTTVGLRLSCFVYRGSGRVTFDPEQIKVWEDTRVGANSPWSPYWVVPPAPPDGTWRIRVSFDEPGQYVLRCRAHDGALAADQDVTINVAR